MNQSSFFSMKSARQPVSSTLVGIFLASWCLWTIVYYLDQSVDKVSAAYQNQQQTIQNNQ
ncbi:MAG: hypothetical protein KBC33_01115 [Candidatus Pacebacteria bacterium]|nr:hypothetical protein [Candidatus Paceibacterota bacterium]